MKGPLGILSATPPTAGGGIARLALTRARDRGIDTTAILRATGITPADIADHKIRISARSQIAVLNLVANALNDDLLGFHLAEGFDLRAIGLLYYVLASSVTFEEALARTARFSTVANESIGVQCLRIGDVLLRVSYIGVPRHADRHQMEFWATALLRVCRKVTGKGIRPIRMRLAHPRRASSDDLERFFGCTIDFAAAVDEIAFPRASLQLRLNGADSYLNELLGDYCTEILRRRSACPTPVRTRVENAIAPLLPHGKARANYVAQALGMNRRMLSRRLAAEGLTFTKVLEEMRRDLAMQYLADPELSISRIAWLVGFQEVAAFSNAFKRWTGFTPTQRRAELSDQDPVAC